MIPAAAASSWTPIRRKVPVAGRLYLVAVNCGGIQTYDAAFYNGRRKDGAHHWMLANIDLDAAAIDAWAEIIPFAGAGSDDK